MKKFRYRLQKILDLARREEDSARLETAEVLQALKRAERRERSLREQVDETMALIQAALTNPSFDPRELARVHAELRVEESLLLSRTEERRDAEAGYEKVRAMLAEKRKKVLTLEKARERALDEWRAEADKEEAERLEEVAIQRHVRLDRDGDERS